MYKTIPTCTFTLLNCKYPYFHSYNTDKDFTNCPSLQILFQIAEQKRFLFPVDLACKSE